MKAGIKIIMHEAKSIDECILTFVYTKDFKNNLIVNNLSMFSHKLEGSCKSNAKCCFT